MSPKAGRPKSDNPKDVRLEIRLTKKESEILQTCAKELGISRTAVIIKGVEDIYRRIGQANKEK